MSVTKKDLTVLNFTRDEYNALDPKVFVDEIAPRISESHALDVLVALVQEGVFDIKAPEVLMNWTYKAVVVAGVNLQVVKEIPGKKVPVVTLSMEEFETTTPEEMGNYFKEYTAVGRAARTLLLIIKNEGFLPSAEKMVQLTNGRITVEGVELPKQVKKVASSILLKGLTINNSVELNA